MDGVSLPSPLRTNHGLAVRLSLRGPLRSAWSGHSLLAGHRVFGWPLMALHASRDLGPVRHALAQRVVSGTMTVHPPLLIQAPPEPTSSDEHSPSVGAP